MALLEIENLTVDFQRPSGPIRVLHGIDLTVRRGEILGLVGESGSGKSVTSLAALRLLGPLARIQGNVAFDGRDILSMDQRALERWRGSDVAMIFQDPMSSLNPVRTIGWQVAEAVSFNTARNNNGRGNGKSKENAQNRSRNGFLRSNGGSMGAEVREATLGLLERVGIPAAQRRIREYPHQLSGGMNQRVMIAMALAGNPKLLIADEPTTALDVTIQAQILTLLKRLNEEFRTAVILITHDLGVVAETCDRMAVMYAGRIVESGSVESIFSEPAHPYTQGLLASLPRIDGKKNQLVAIRGTVPSPDELPEGCAFEPRCDKSFDRCMKELPELLPLDNGRETACFAAREQR